MPGWSVRAVSIHGVLRYTVHQRNLSQRTARQNLLGGNEKLRPGLFLLAMAQQQRCPSKALTPLSGMLWQQALLHECNALCPGHPLAAQQVLDFCALLEPGVEKAEPVDYSTALGQQLFC